jgi:shikimate kinase/3-dehydroquinate synthase
VSRVCLTGFMGAGKSTVGAIVAERLGLRFIDLDREIEAREHAQVPEIFSARGEDGFRVAESEALADVLAGPDAVVACGGGVVLRDANRAAMRAAGHVVYLSVSAEEALARIGDTSGRPLLAGDGQALAQQILGARLSLYRACADVIVDTAGRTADEVADEVVEELRSAEQTRVTVTASRSYEIVVGRGLTERLGEMVAAATAARRVAVITDTNVAPLHLSEVRRTLDSAGIASEALIVPAGEPAKRWEQAGELLERLAASGLGRDGAILALGGGVVGDLGGFVAATYLRGIDLVHVPTTLLAQVDSSIGGKTAVDLHAGKNLAGAIWQPALVVADLGMLGTLPDGEWSNGLAECAKTALLAGAEETAYLEAEAEHIIARDARAVHHAVLMCVRFKAGVVSGDERETGERECLNLGHTLAHALEHARGYGSLAHGTAVAEGLRFAAALAEDVAAAPTALAEDVAAAPTALANRVGALLDALGIGRVERSGLDVASLLDAMRRDKKARDGRVRFVLLRAPGQWLVTAVDEATIMRHLERWLENG